MFQRMSLPFSTWSASREHFEQAVAEDTARAKLNLLWLAAIWADRGPWFVDDERLRGRGSTVVLAATVSKAELRGARETIGHQESNARLLRRCLFHFCVEPPRDLPELKPIASSPISAGTIISEDFALVASALGEEYKASLGTLLRVSIIRTRR